MYTAISSLSAAKDIRGKLSVISSLVTDDKNNNTFKL